MFLISILILTRNRINELRNLVKSIYELEGCNGKEFEVLILDNASDIKLTPEDLHISGNKKPFIIRSDNNIGLAAGRNMLAQKASGEWLFFIDDDAFIAERQFLSNFVRFIDMLKNNKLSVVACNLIEYYKPWKNLYPFSKKYLKKINLKEPIKCSYFLGGAHFIKRDVFLKLNGYDEKLFFWGEELDFSYKVINSGYEIYYNPDLLIIHKASKIKNLQKNEEHYYFIRNKIYINYKYLPWYIRWISNFVWLTFYFIQTKSISILFKATREAQRMSKIAKREILSYEALKYLHTNYGRIFY